MDIAELEAAVLRPYAAVEIISDDFARVFDPAMWMGVDVAVLDLMLPDIMGEDICKFLRVQFPTIRRIICTAKPMYELVELRKIADVVLQKPFRPEDLVAAVIGVHDDLGG